MIRASQLMQELKISKPTLYRWLKKGCPVHYVGRMPYFDMVEVTKWMKKQKKGEQKNEINKSKTDHL